MTIYKDNAKPYREAGFAPIPVIGKWPPPSDATGNDGIVNDDKIAAWRKSRGSDNIAIRAEGWIAIDVDHYGDKLGADDLARLEDELGKLPATFTSTARGKKTLSRQHLFRVLDGDRFMTKIGKSIEVIQFHHRYTVVAPSVHPDLNAEYRWYGPDGKKLKGIPHIDEIPDLPEAWLDYLKAAPMAALSAAETVELDAFLSTFTEGVPCYRTKKLQDELEALDASSHIGHDDAQRFMIASLMLGRERHTGAEALFRDVVARFSKYLERERPHGAKGEVERLIEFASTVAQRKELESTCQCSNVGDFTDLSEEEIQAELAAGPLLKKNGALLTETARERFLADHPVRRYAESQGASFVWVDNGWRATDLEEVAYRWLSARIGDEMTAAKGRELEKAAMMHADVVSDTDIDDRYISFTNGLLNWETGELVKRTRDIFVIAHLPVAWRPDAKPGRFDEWMQSTFEPEIVSHIWEIIGYTLSPVHDQKVAFALSGAGGGGKSVLLNCIRNLFGPKLTSALAPQELGNRFNRARIHGKHVNIAADVGAETIRNAGVFKSIIARDEIGAEYKGKDGFSFIPNVVSFASFNTLPATESNDSGFWDRWIVIPFSRRFNDDRTAGDTYYRDRMPNDPDILEGVVVKAIEALRRMRRRGGLEKEAFLQSKNEWRREVDSIAAFAEDRIAIDPEGMVAAKAVHSLYQQLEISNGGSPRNSRTFYRELAAYLEEKFPGKVHRRNGTANVLTFYGFRVRHLSTDPNAFSNTAEELYGKRGWLTSEPGELQAL